MGNHVCLEGKRPFHHSCKSLEVLLQWGLSSVSTPVGRLAMATEHLPAKHNIKIKNALFGMVWMPRYTGHFCCISLYLGTVASTWEKQGYPATQNELMKRGFQIFGWGETRPAIQPSTGFGVGDPAGNRTPNFCLCRQRPKPRSYPEVTIEELKTPLGCNLT